MVDGLKGFGNGLDISNSPGIKSLDDKLLLLTEIDTVSFILYIA